MKYCMEQIEESNDYYRKSPIPWIKRYRGLVSDLIDFSLPIAESKEPIGSVPCWRLNNPNRLTSLIREKERDVLYYSEGLIRTVDKSALQRHYQKECEKVIPKDILELKMNEVFKGYGGTEKVKEHIEFNRPNENISPLTRFVFGLFSTGDEKKDESECKRSSKPSQTRCIGPDIISLAMKE